VYRKIAQSEEPAKLKNGESSVDLIFVAMCRGFRGGKFWGATYGSWGSDNFCRGCGGTTSKYWKDLEVEVKGKFSLGGAGVKGGLSEKDED